MKVLIIGGAGYVGSHTVRELRRDGVETIIYDNLSTGYSTLVDGCEFIRDDIANRSALTSALMRVDAVMHFAANAYVDESVRNPGRYFKNNIVNGLELLDACIATDVKYLIFSSTCAVYGIPATLSIHENSPLNPISPYGVSKLFFERAMAAYEKAHGLRFASLRYFNASGADEDGSIGELHEPETHLIPSALSVVFGINQELPIFGNDYPTRDGTCIRDYVHVSDLAKAHGSALRRLISTQQSFTVNLGTGQGYSVNEILCAIEKLTGCQVPRRYMPRRLGDPPSLIADSSRARDLLGWRAKRSLDTIIYTAWKWKQNCLLKRTNVLPLVNSQAVRDAFNDTKHQREITRDIVP